jgi:oxygen-independent coproporphyrinogen-3 oxidase
MRAIAAPLAPPAQAGNPAAQVDFASITPELLARHDRPGPRYTSYPTAPQFQPDFSPGDYRAALARAATRPAEPLSLYIHIPFCQERCTYCGCNVVIARRRGIEEGYLNVVEAELALLADALGQRRGVAQLHWGGGTPTFLTPSQCRRLHTAVTRHFELLPGAEVAVEVDPCVTSDDHLATLRELGFNRISLGLQDLDPTVQAAVRRVQPLELTRHQVQLARQLGFVSVNLDLIYGLPHQTPEGFARTVNEVITYLAPDRVAVFSYAHVPWLKSHQKALEALPLPRGWEKFRIFRAAAEEFLRAGYTFIGMDHFARPEDELARALEAGTLHRNFMGYTVQPGSDLLGVGVTSIGDVAGCYVQNEKHLARFGRAISAGEFAVERGRRRTAEDELRGAVIRRLICTFTLPFDWLARRFGVDAEVHFAKELAELRRDFADDGLVAVEADGVRVLPRGRVFIRNICMVFDAYLRAGTGAAMYSRTV